MPQWCAKHQQHTIDEICPGCEREANEAARLKVQCKALIAALKGVKSTSRGTLCWCDHSHDVRKHGHQAKCDRAFRAIKYVMACSDF